MLLPKRTLPAQEARDLPPLLGAPTVPLGLAASTYGQCPYGGRRAFGGASGALHGQRWPADRVRTARERKDGSRDGDLFFLTGKGAVYLSSATTSPPPSSLPFGTLLWERVVIAQREGCVGGGTEREGERKREP